MIRKALMSLVQILRIVRNCARTQVFDAAMLVKSVLCLRVCGASDLCCVQNSGSAHENTPFKCALKI